jgi:hypothetical protein
VKNAHKSRLNQDEQYLAFALNRKVADRFRQQVRRRGFKGKVCHLAAISLWLTLPEDIQAALMSLANDDQTIKPLRRTVINAFLDSLDDADIAEGRPEEVNARSAVG